MLLRRPPRRRPMLCLLEGLRPPSLVQSHSLRLNPAPNSVPCSPKPPAQDSSGDPCLLRTAGSGAWPSPRPFSSRARLSTHRYAHGACRDTLHSQHLTVSVSSQQTHGPRRPRMPQSLHQHASPARPALPDPPPARRHSSWCCAGCGGPRRAHQEGDCRRLAGASCPRPRCQPHARRPCRACLFCPAPSRCPVCGVLWT